MNCNRCGQMEPEGVLFCSNCGAALTAPKQTGGKGLRLTSGLVFVVMGALLMLMPTLMKWVLLSDSYYQQVSSGILGDIYLSAHSMVLGFCALGDSAVYPLIGLFSMVTGFALLTGRSGAGKAAVAAVILQLLMLLYPVLTQLVIWFSPDLLKAMDADSTLVAAMNAMLRKGSTFSWWYVAAGGVQLLGFVAETVCTVLLIAKRSGRLFKKLHRGVFALLAAAPMYCLFELLRTFLPSMMAATYGVAASTAQAAASSVTQELPVIPVLLCLLVCMLLWKKNYLLPALPLVVLTVVSSAVMLVLGLVKSGVMPYGEDIKALVPSAIVWRMVGLCVLQLGLVLWTAASARGNIPGWAQILVSLALPAVYLGLELGKTLLLHMSFYLPFGNVGVGLLLTGVSVLCVLVCKGDAKREAEI